MSELASSKRDELVEAFRVWARESQAFSTSELRTFVRQFNESAAGWSCTVTDATTALQTAGALSMTEIPSEGSYRSMYRYLTPEATGFDVAAKLRPRGYFSHATAVFAHGLTEQIPQTIYINDEQSEKPAPTGRLSQASLDRAFKSRQRVSKFVFVYARNRIVIINGKRTNSLGVERRNLGGGEHLVTDLERTLIDIAVRPVYGGGIYEILASYRAALPRINIGRIVEYLETLDYVYPYHQAIGFYLERAGASAATTELLRQFGLEYDFYLVHALKAPVLDPSWRLYIPDGL